MDNQKQTIKVIDVEPKIVLVETSDGEQHRIYSKCFKGKYPFIGSCYEGKYLNDLSNNLGESWKVSLKTSATITPFDKIKSKNEEIKLKLSLLYFFISDCIGLKYYNNVLERLKSLGYEISNFNLLPCYTIEKNGLSNLFYIFSNNSDNQNQLKIDFASFFKKKSGKGWEIIKKEINRIYMFYNDKKEHQEKYFQEYITNLTDFSKSSSIIKIYIDEAWISKTNKGLICGLVWDGDSVDKRLLQTRLTHEDEKEELENDPKQLLKCKKALPFILSFDENNYSEIFTKAIKFILGWLLPQKGKACEVIINAEYYSNNTGEFSLNTDKTKEFQILFKELQTKSKYRYQRWIIKEVKWKDKNYEYIPYGDLLGYIGKQDKELSIKYYKYHNFDGLYGVVYFPNGYLELLDKLDQDEFNAKNYIEFIKTTIENVFTNKLTKIIDSYIKNKDFAEKQIIEETEKYFSNKEISIKEQEEIVRLINKHITLENIDKTTSSRSRFTWYTQLIKDANNHGEPLKIYDYLKKYNKLKEKVIENDRELVAKSDLNIIVSLNDFFDFETAYNFAKKNREDPSFRYLSLFNRAKISSSFAQTLSFNNEYDKAEEYYKEAYTFLKESDIDEIQKGKNLKQILTYRVINAFEGNLENKDKIFNKLFTNPQVAYSKLKGNKITDTYLIYTLLRIAYFSSDYKRYYLGLPEEDKLGSMLYHPWELIYLYDALLSKDKTRFNKLKKSINICFQDNQGPTMKFIGYVINLISEMLGTKIITISNNEIKEYLNKNLTPALEYFNKIIDIRESNKPKDKMIQQILECLPFNYH